jgi:hypothetical protein
LAWNSSRSPHRLPKLPAFLVPRSTLSKRWRGGGISFRHS